MRHRHIPHPQHIGRGQPQRIAAASHRRGASVVGITGKNHLIAANADDARNDPNGRFCPRQQAPLLHMQLHIRRQAAHRPRRLGDAVGVKPSFTQNVGQGTAVPPHPLQQPHIIIARHQPAAHRPPSHCRLLGSKINDRHRMAQPHPRRLQRPHRRQRRQHPQCPVIFPPVRHGVGVGGQGNGGQIWLGAGVKGNRVPRCILRHCQPQLFHFTAHPGAAGPVRRPIRQPHHPARRLIHPNLRQHLQIGQQLFAVKHCLQRIDCHRYLMIRAYAIRPYKCRPVGAYCIRPFFITRKWYGQFQPQANKDACHPFLRYHHPICRAILQNCSTHANMT